MEIQGVVEEIIFQNEENGYTIASVDSDDERIIVVGYMPAVKEGEIMKFVGEVILHKTYGEQFKCTSSEIIEPTEIHSITKYLGSGIIKGIGPALAERIVNKFGEDTLDVMRFNPNKLSSISGIGESKLKKIISSFNEHRAMSNVVIFLQKYDISIAYAAKIYKEYKEKTIEKISENPYILAEEIKGIGFKMSDDIAKTMGIDSDSPYRLYSGIKHVLGLIVHQGHTFAYEDDLIRETCSILKVKEESVKEELTELLIKGDIHRTTFDERSVIYLVKYYNAELNVCKRLSKLATSQVDVLDIDMEYELDLREKEENMLLAEKQKTAISESVKQGVMVITGGPGTGKTTIINSIIKIFEKQKLKVLLAAPTGRAAKRMSEATGMISKTIHRLLEYQFSDSGYLGFNKDAANPLVADIIIIDEASMLDILLTESLLEAVSYGTRMIFVGDVDQLPSVGAGDVLRDIIKSNIVEIVKLDEIFRQAGESMIVTNAHRINNGKFPILNEKNKDFYFIKANSYEEVLKTIVNLCKDRLPNYYDFDSIKDIQVLSPMRNSKVGVNSLNESLQYALNPPSKDKNERKYRDQLFREGDKVMQIKNNYSIKWKQRYTYENGEGVFNGDIGYIHEINTKGKTILVIFDDDREVLYDFSQLEELNLSYAVTVHKSQGSEFPVIVMPLYSIAPMLRNRNILYTAITRARSLVVLVGSEAQLNGMIANISNAIRNSGLTYMFKMVSEGLSDVKN